MDTPLPLIPWNTSSLWHEANAAIGHLLRHHRQAVVESRMAAEQIRSRLASIFPIMDRLCGATCPDCSDICCQHACVWIDFRDLLFLHLTAIPLPGQQLLAQQGERCRYSTPEGCRLEREQRPYVCTWYLCPAQTELLRQQPATMQEVTSSLQQIKRLRRLMEQAFIRAGYPATDLINPIS